MSAYAPPSLAPPADTPPTDLAPLSIIRTETVLSRLPIHNLSKKGRVNIHITQKNAHGDIALRWEVSYSGGMGRRDSWPISSIRS